MGIADAIRGAAERPMKRVNRRPTADPRDFFAFVSSKIGTDSGAFTFRGYKPLKEIGEVLCRNDAERVNILKPTQCGYTTLLGFGFPLWQADRNGRTTMYFLPTDGMAEDMIKARLREALTDSGLDVDMTSSDGILLVGERHRRVLWRGLNTVRSAISWPTDIIVLDEVDDLNQDHAEMARQRMDNSSYAHEVSFACGRFPGEGIHGRYLEGDRRRWLVTCPGCRHEHVPEDAFPGNVEFRDDRHVTVCPDCRKAISFEQYGRFVAMRPDVKDIISFQCSVLAFGKTGLSRIMAEWRLAQNDRKKLANFRSSKLATPDAGDRAELTAQDLMRALSPGARSAAPRYIGVDTGDICHIAAGDVFGDGTLGIGVFDAVPGEQLLSRLDALDAECRLHGAAGISVILIDQKPEGALARAVCRRFPGRAWLQEFRVAEKETEKELLGERFDRLQFDREETVSHFCDRIKAGTVVFPAEFGGTPFERSTPGQHMLTGSQKVDKRDANGLTVRKFRSGSVENHYLMASVFAMVIGRSGYDRQRAVLDARLGVARRVAAPESGRARSSSVREEMMR